MEEEGFQRANDIILQNRAQFYVDLQQMQEANKEIQETNKGIQQTNKEMQEIQKEAEKRTNVLERVCPNLYNTSTEQTKNIGQLSENVRELRDGQKRNR